MIPGDAISPVPVQHIHALYVSGLAHHHKDPFDRMIICQAMIERIPILTVDPQFEPYDVKILRAN